MRKIEDKEIVEVFAQGIFAAFAIGGLLADPDVSPTDRTCAIAWETGDKMCREFMRRIEVVFEKEKQNGR